MRSFAILPAAGRSVRMGRPKLLLPWRNAAIIDAVLQTWLAARVDRVVVVVRADDQALANACQAAAEAAGDERLAIVRPTPDPLDMKASVAAALRWLATHEQPTDDDVWLLAPADLPTLSRETIERMLAAADSGRREICVPLHGGRRGHPVVFPWRLACAVDQLGEDEGINRLLTMHPVREVPDELESPPSDIDTPADYARMVERGEMR
ncbi:MAG: nucleotidyltransferase family protein [Pirellulales bacterium]